MTTKTAAIPGGTTVDSRVWERLSRALDRYPFNGLRRYGLPIWFAAFSAVWLGVSLDHGVVFAHDQYLVITREWLAGADPYAIDYKGWFAAPPITLLPMIPFAVLPFGQWLLLATTVAGGIATVRMLELPWWWLLFPPLFIAMIGGGLDAWLVPLILARHGWLAVLAKAYAAVPLAILGRWRPILIAAAVTAVTWPLLPWPEYIAGFSTIQRHLADQAMNLSAPLLLAPVAILALVLMGRERAAWLAVPALWPSTQWYYAVIAMPALGRMPLVALSVALPMPGLVVVGMLAQALWERARQRFTPTM